MPRTLIKAVLLGIAYAAGFFTLTTYEILHPTVASNIAVSQLDDSEAAAITLRSLSMTYPQLEAMFWLAAGLVGVGVFAPEIVSISRKVLK